MAEIVFSGDTTEWLERGLLWVQQHLTSRAALLQALLALAVCLAAWGACRALGLGRKPQAEDAGWKVDALIAPFLHELRRCAWVGVAGLLLIMKGLALFVALIQAARLGAGILDDRLHKAEGLSPSAQALFAKGARFGLYALAITVTLSTVGVDLTSLTVFSGAVGVGIGFGLQKIFSNLVSGVILLVDKSLKPGDVIEMGGVQGRIAQINARYAAIETLDGKAYLIPNESLIANEVINLSYSNSRLLLRAEVGTSYGGDPRAAMRLMEQAALSVPRVLKDPAPSAMLTAFGDSSVNLAVGFWIEDPENGTGNVRGEVLLAIWDAFKQGGVNIPFPQREVRMLGGGAE